MGTKSFQHPSAKSIKGKIHLKVSGFAQQHIVSIDDITESISEIPAAHIVGLTEIEYDPLRINQKFDYFDYRVPNLNALGEYRNKPDRIWIYKFDSLSQCRHLLFHEIGHFFYFTHLDSKLRKSWATSISKQGGFISSCASRNAAEDFAECYAYYLNDPGKLATFKHKRLFFSQRIFC